MNIQNSDIIIHYIKKKNKYRKLVSYRSNDCDLRKKHTMINNFLNAHFIPSKFAKGYVKKRSIYHNALTHMYNDYFIMLDIKDFFSHICHKQLVNKLYYELNSMKKNQINMKECNDIIESCSVSSRGLPLGFITSPVLSNIYMKEFDCVFYGNLKKLNIDKVLYTRYVDDMVISFKYPLKGKNLEIESVIIELASSLLKKYGLQINKKKTRSYNLNTSNHVRITGINIIKSDSNYRYLSVGRTEKNKLFWDSIKCFKTPENRREFNIIEHIKGMQSFILSIEKEDYEDCFSDSMHQYIHSLGFKTLKELIDSL